MYATKIFIRVSLTVLNHTGLTEIKDIVCLFVFNNPLIAKLGHTGDRTLA